MLHVILSPCILRTMQFARTFTIAGYKLDRAKSTFSFEYEVEFGDGECRQLVDTVILPAIPKENWDVVPPKMLRSVCETLSILIGTKYWRVGCAPVIRIRDFELSKSQAQFWNEFYTKGLGEFFYTSNIDFRDLVSFPYNEVFVPAKPTSFPRKARALAGLGGGKDSIVTSELLAERNIPFDIFMVAAIKEQEKVAKILGRSVVAVQELTDYGYRKVPGRKKGAQGFPIVSIQTGIAVLVAALQDYRYVIFSNEQSADIGNMNYLGLEVNHQWSKSSEAEAMLRAYLEQYVTKDIVPFSLIRGYSELEMVRRFAKYKKYFYAFSSCNMGMAGSWERPAASGKSYWCGKCPKCAFIFACLSAFIPLEEVTDIFGKNLYADPELLVIFKRLLGMQGTKPFECVGVPEETIVAMYMALKQGTDREDLPIIKIFKEYLKTYPVKPEELEKAVFSPHPVSVPPPEDFTALYSGALQLV